MDTIADNSPWARVQSALGAAVSIGWDGCHKIYVAMDQAQHDEMRDMGYVMTPVDEGSLDTLREWFEQSCSLRFINAVRSVAGDPNEGFTPLIAQFEIEDAEDA